MTQPAAKVPEKRVTREQIVRVAMEHFAARGYRGASLDKIAAQVGVSRQGVLHHFPSKVKLLLAVLELRDQEDNERYTRLAAEHGWSLVDVFPQILRYTLEHPELARLYTVLAAEAVDPEHPAHAWFVERYRRVREQVIQGIEAEQARGRLPQTVAPEPWANALLALLDGLQLQAFLDPDALDAEQALASVAPLMRATDGQ